MRSIPRVYGFGSHLNAMDTARPIVSSTLQVDHVLSRRFHVSCSLQLQEPVRHAYLIIRNGHFAIRVYPVHLLSL